MLSYEYSTCHLGPPYFINVLTVTGSLFQRALSHLNLIPAVLCLMYILDNTEIGAL